MARRDPLRTQKLRIAVRYLLERECLAKGNQSRLAEHFKVSRQRVHQIVVEERQRFQQEAPVDEQPIFPRQTASIV
jgi:predicted XRE-type DNA-binding protein